jgi:hypothetical protein
MNSAVVDSDHLAKHSQSSWSVDVPSCRFGSVTSGNERSWRRFPRMAQNGEVDPEPDLRREE